jgi:hypothetical protein
MAGTASSWRALRRALGLLAVDEPLDLEQFADALHRLQRHG